MTKNDKSNTQVNLAWITPYLDAAEGDIKAMRVKPAVAVFDALEKRLADKELASVFHLDDEGWEKMMAELNRPPVDSPGLEKLFSIKPPWTK